MSRLTLRRALESLVAEGVLQRRTSRGWFVAGGPVTGATNELLSFAQMGLARGLVPSARVLEHTVRPATFEESDVLRVAPGAPIFDIERLRMLDGIPILVDGSRIPVARAPWLADLDFRSASLYASLEERGLVPTSADYTIGVLDADERLAALLDVPVGKGLLLATGVTRDQLGKPFELARAAYRADRYRIEVTLARGPIGADLDVTSFDVDILAQGAVLARLLDVVGRPARGRDGGPGGARPDAPVILTGMGASFAAISIAEPVLRTAGRQVGLTDAGELGLFGAEALAPGTLVLMASQTGQSRETVATATALRGRGSTVIALVNDLASPLADVADLALSIEAGPEDANACKTFTATQLLALQVCDELLGPRAPAIALDRRASRGRPGQQDRRPGRSAPPAAGSVWVRRAARPRPGDVDGALRRPPGQGDAGGPRRGRHRLRVPPRAGRARGAPHRDHRPGGRRPGSPDLARAGRQHRRGVAAPSGSSRPAAPTCRTTPGVTVTDLGVLDQLELPIVAAAAMQRFFSAFAGRLGRTPGVFTAFDPLVDTGREEARSPALS